MASIRDIKNGIYDTLTLAGLDVSVYRHQPATSPNYPAVVVQPAATDYTSITARKGGQDVYEFDLIVLVSGAELDVAQEALDDYLDPTGDLSIRALFEANRTLGLDDNRTVAWIDRMSEYGVSLSRDPDIQDLGAVLRLIVRTTN